MLSPQHWAKTQCRSKLSELRYGETTYRNRSILFWGNIKLTIPLGDNDNVATFRTAPGYDKYQVFCHQCKFEVDYELSRPAIIEEATLQDVANDDVKVS